MGFILSHNKACLYYKIYLRPALTHENADSSACQVSKNA